MKISDCKKFRNYQRRTWAQRHEPNTYHAIGFSHAYGYCKKFGERCLGIKKCEVQNEQK